MKEYKDLILSLKKISDMGIVEKENVYKSMNYSDIMLLIEQIGEILSLIIRKEEDFSLDMVEILKITEELKTIGNKAVAMQRYVSSQINKNE